MKFGFKFRLLWTDQNTLVCVPSVPDAIQICFVVSDGYGVPILSVANNAVRTAVSWDVTLCSLDFMKMLVTIFYTACYHILKGHSFSIHDCEILTFYMKF